MALEAQELQARADCLTSAVAEALPTLRISSGINQSFLATSSGISQPYLSQLENGERSSTNSILTVTQTLHDYSRRASRDLAAARKEKR